MFSPTFLVKVDGYQAKTPTHKIQEKDGTQLEQNETVSEEFNFSVTEFLVGNLIVARYGDAPTRQYLKFILSISGVSQ